MARQKKGFKVVEDHKGKLVSCICWHRKSTVVYKIGKISRPRSKCGPLCVFTSAKDALAFIERFGGRMFECLYNPSKRREVWDYEDKTTIACLPKGSALATQVILVRPM